MILVDFPQPHLQSFSKVVGTPWFLDHQRSYASFDYSLSKHDANCIPALDRGTGDRRFRKYWAFLASFPTLLKRIVGRYTLFKNNVASAGSTRTV